MGAIEGRLASPLFPILLLILTCCFSAEANAQTSSAQEACNRATASAESQRIALIIANWDYNGDGSANTRREVSQASGYLRDLANPRNDGLAICGALGRLGFAVTLIENADRHDLTDQLARFSGQIDRAGANAVVIIYYSGHALQLNGVSYLLPVRAQLPVNEDLTRQTTRQQELTLRVDAIALNDILEVLREPSARGLNLVILDACRDNSWEQRLTGQAAGSRTRGIADRMPSLPGTIIAYSTASGAEADDGAPGATSPYTTALLRWIEHANVSVIDMLNQVAREVASQHRQTPTTDAAAPSDLCLAGCPLRDLGSAPPPDPDVRPAPPPDARPPAPPVGAVARESARRALAAIPPQQWSVGTDVPILRRLLQAAPLSAYIDLADEDVPRAKTVAGIALFLGAGRPRDAPGGRRWLELAALEHEPRAILHLGKMYEEGDGYPIDYAHAFRLYLDAADLGNALSQFSVGQMYDRGTAPDRNFARAAHYYGLAANQGMARADYALARLLYDGMPGLPRNRREAWERMTRAARTGLPDANRWLSEHRELAPLR
jgi:hypothetical protein